MLWVLTLLMFFYDKAADYALAIAVHECGHLFAMRLCRVGVRSLVLSSGGLVIELSGAVGYKRNLFVSAAGPIFSVGLYFLSLPFFPSLAAVSLMLGLLNMLPFPSFDGYGVVVSALGIILPSGAPYGLIRALEWLCIAILCAASLTALIVTRYNMWSLLFTAYAFCGVFLQKR